MPVKNQDLWQRLEQALGTHRIVWRWVKGHSGNPDNDRADQPRPPGHPHRSRGRGGYGSLAALVRTAWTGPFGGSPGEARG